MTHSATGSQTLKEFIEMSSPHVLPYRNAMEPLAASEVEHQLQQLPTETANSINRASAIAYALNRLPPLYATSVEGWHWQQERAQESFKDLIVKAAGWGLKAVQRNPLQISTPLLQMSESEAALQQLKELLGCEELNWQNLAAVVEQKLVQTELGQISWQKREESLNLNQQPKPLEQTVISPLLSLR